MELIATIAYYFLVRLIFIDYKLIPFNLFWKFIVCGLYVSAALTEILLLGQFTPYSSYAFTQSYVVQMAPEYGGNVKEVYIQANQPVKKGDPLFKMDPQSWEDRVREHEAQLELAKSQVATLKAQVDEAKARVTQSEGQLKLSQEKLDELTEAKKKNAVSLIRIQQEEQGVRNAEAQLSVDKATLIAAQIAYDAMVDGQHAQIAEIQAKLDTAKYNLKHTIIRAPSDGYVPNMQLHAGSFIRMKQPVMPFVSTEEYWIIGGFNQRGMQHVHVGDKAEVAFAMYPGQVFEAEVISIGWASGAAQGVPSGVLPADTANHPSEAFPVRVKLTGDSQDYPLRFGASALIAIHTKGTIDALILLRQLEIRSESYLNYAYNPFF